jgi:hypothetical protein
MPGGYIIDEEREIVFSRGWSSMCGDDLLLHAHHLAADQRFVRWYRQLVDLRDVTHVEVTENAVWTLANDSPFGAGARRAVVVGSNVAFGLARMFETLRDGLGEEILVSRDMDEAIRWLELDDARGAVLETLERVPDMITAWAGENVNKASGSGRKQATGN